MKAMQIAIGALFWFAAPLLSGPATKAPKEPAETFPILLLAPNSSGIALVRTELYGPKSLLGYLGATPDIPSRTVASVERIHPTGALNAVLGGLCVTSIERPAAYDRGTIRFADTIHKWKLLIDGESMTNDEADKILYQDQLDEIPWQDAGRRFPAKLRRRAFPWGKAVIFLTTGYAQGPMGGLVNNEMLTFVVQGITNNGRYGVNGHFAIHRPNLPNSAEDKNRNGKVIFDIDKQGESAAKWLDTQPDDSFEPTFLQYETFLESLRIER
jgi:hypothetical protein